MNERKSVLSEETVSMPRIDESYLKIQHESGLSIYVHPKDMSVTYAILCVNFGSMDQSFVDENGYPCLELPHGTAHFMEHKIFENEDGSDSFERFSALGADANAYTTHNRTVYLFNCTEYFDECLEELLHFVTHPCFRKESIDRERDIIAQEILMYEDNPYSRAQEALIEAMYFKHPIKNKVSGTVESIEDITAETLYECHSQFYKASEMSLVICGNADPDNVVSIVDKVMIESNPSRGKRRLKVTSFEEPITVRCERVEIQMPINRPILNLGFKLPVPLPEDASIERDLALDLICEMLFSRSTELYSTLFDGGFIAPWFSSSLADSEDYANISISTETEHCDKVIELIENYIDQKLENGFESEEFERCRRVGYAELISTFDSTEDIAEFMIEGIVKHRNIYDYITTVESLTKEYVESVFRQTFSNRQKSVVIITPTN
ncbi:MAG: insulinase family protein [Clostridia bacterium]|nr:insulinase family protein [Clostridia bacterium]